MTSLLPQINAMTVPKVQSAQINTSKPAVVDNVKNKNTSQRTFELVNFPTSNMLAQYVRSVEMVQNVDNVKPLERFEWKNDLRSMIQDNKAVIWAIVPRTFNAHDKNGNDIIDDNEKKGTFLNAIERLDELVALGVNTIHVLPVHQPGSIHAMGLSGSLYAPKDLLKIDPELRDKRSLYSVEDQFKMFIDACHKKNIRVMLDLPSCASCDLYEEKPEYMAFERNGNAKTPQGWNDIRMFDPWADETKRTLNPYLLDLHKKYIDMCIDLKIDGIRADVARAKPPEFWDIIIPYSHSKDPNFAWLAETYTYEDASPQLNMPYDRPKDSLKAGFDTYYGQYHIFNEWSKAHQLIDYVKENIEMSHEQELPAGKSLIGSFATHDDVSPMFHGGVDYCNLTTGLQAVLPMLNPYFVDGFQSGDKYLYKYENRKTPSMSPYDTKKCDVHRGKLDIFNHSRKPGGGNPEIGEFVKSAMKFRKENQDIISKGSFIPLQSEENSADQIITFARHYKGKTLLVIANRDINNRQKGLVNVPGLKQGTKLKNLVAKYGQNSYFQVKEDGKVSVDLGKARFHVFEINTPQIEKSGLEVLKQKL